MERKTVKPRANKDTTSNINQVPVVRRKSEQNKPTKMSKRSTWLKIVLPIALAVVLVTSTVLALVLASNKKYKVNFYIGDNLVCSQSIKDDVATPPTDEELSNKIPEGYLIEGWYKDAYFSERFDFQEKITQKTNIYGKLVEDEEIYTISYNYTDGDGTVLSTEVVEGDTLPSEDRPTGTRTYYDFGGWGLNPTDTSSIEDDYIFTSSTTLYAIWNRKQVHISFSVGYVDSERTEDVDITVNAGIDYVINLQDLGVNGEYVLSTSIIMNEEPKELGDSIRIEEDDVTATVELDEYFLILKDSEGDVLEKYRSDNDSLTFEIPDLAANKTQGTGTSKTYFTGWTTTNSATESTYWVDATYDFTEQTTLYAVYEAGSYEDLSFTLITDAINGNYYSVAGSNNQATRLIIPDNYAGLPVKAISTDACKNYTNLINVYLPTIITSIGTSSFDGCTALRSIIIPDGVTNIRTRLFYNCRAMTSITIPDSVTSVGDHAFDNCRMLKNIPIPNDVTSLGDYVFYNSGLTNIIIPDGITSIGEYSFFGCIGLTNITIPDNVAGIGEMAFASCGGLISITFGDGVRSIGDRAFLNCSKVMSITIPSGVTSIGSSAFGGCYALTNISVAEGNAIYHSAGNCLIATSTKTLLQGTNISVIPSDENIQFINEGAFSGFTGLTSVTIPDGVTSIGNGAFDGCTELASVIIPNSVAIIESNAFNNCSRLTSLVIGNGVTRIKSYAFQGCSRLTSITIPESVTSIGNYAFANCTGLTIINYNATNMGDVISYASIFYNVGTSKSGITLNIGDNIRYIPANLFYNSLSKIIAVRMGSDVESIGANAIRSSTTIQYILCSNATVAGVVNNNMTTTNIYVANDGTYSHATYTGGVEVSALLYREDTTYGLDKRVIGDYTFVRTGDGTSESPYVYYIDYALV